MANPWDNDEIVTPTQGGGVQIKASDPKLPLEVQRLQQQLILSQQENARQGQQAGESSAKTANTLSDTRFNNISGVRKEYDAQQVVKEYRAILPLLMSGLESAPNAQGDNALIYAYAKTMDPGSVVREAEGANASSTAGYWSAKAEQLKKDLGWDEARGLPADAARGLRVEMNRKVGAMAKAYGVQRQRFQKLAQDNGFAPDQVVGPMEATPFLGRYEQAMKRLRGEDKTLPGAAPTISQDKYATPEDKRLAKAFNNVFQSGAPVEQLQQLSQDLYGVPLDKQQLEYIGLRDRGEKVSDFAPGASGDASGFQSFMGAVAENPAGTAVGSYLNAAGAGIPQLLAGDAPFEAMRNENFKSALAGDVLGGITGTGLGAAGLAKAGVAAPRALLGANLGYGTMFGANTSEDDRLQGAGVGLAASALGEGLGRFAVAPAVRAIGDSQIGQRALGMFGRRGRDAAASIPGALGSGQNEAAGAIAPLQGETLDRMREAASLGLPYAAADASPELRYLAGSATRNNLGARSAAEASLLERAGNQRTRALGAVSRDLAEPVPLDETARAIRGQAQDAASPFYEAAYAKPAIATPELSGILQRPSLRNAMGRAENIIAEEGGSPQTMGFALDAAGNPVLNPVPERALSELGAAQTALSDAQDAMARSGASLDPRGSAKLQSDVVAAQQRLEAAQAGMAGAPSEGTLAQAPGYSWKALDYTKRGLDDVVEQFRNPITRRLELDEGGRAIDKSRTQFRTALGNLNDDYKQGLDAYSGVIRGRDALFNGYGSTGQSTTPNQLTQAMTGNADNMGRFQEGYATSLADRIGNVPDNGNPYEAIAKMQSQRDKLGMVFPDGADRFLRQRQFEADMAKTGQEIYGGSQTQPRAAADALFNTQSVIGVPEVAETAISAATGIPPVNAGLRLAGKAGRGMFGARATKRAEAKAAEIAPILLNTDTNAAIDEILRLSQMKQARDAYSKRISGVSGLATGGALGGAAQGFGF